MGVEGKVGIVTGGARNLGAAYARGLSSAGATVVVADADGEAAAGLVDELVAAGGTAMPAVCDTSNEGQVEAMVDATVETYGGIDILVNNAGWRPVPAGDLYGSMDYAESKADWMRVLEVNVVGPWLCSEAVRPHMRARGGGTIIMQSSNAAYVTGGGVYAVSKAAVNGLTMNLATDYAADGIRVNGIAPGVMTGRGKPEVMAWALANQMIQRSGTPEDLIGTLLFLCSDASDFITGQTFTVDGGQSRRY